MKRRLCPREQNVSKLISDGKRSRRLCGKRSHANWLMPENLKNKNKLSVKSKWPSKEGKTGKQERTPKPEMRTRIVRQGSAPCHCLGLHSGLSSLHAWHFASLHLPDACASVDKGWSSGQMKRYYTSTWMRAACCVWSTMFVEFTKGSLGCN